MDSQSFFEVVGSINFFINKFFEVFDEFRIYLGGD